MCMTTTKKLDTLQLLSGLVTSKSSGCLELSNKDICWKIYLEQGNLKYIYCSVELLEQLEYYLHYLGLKEAASALKHLPVPKSERQSTAAKQENNLHLYSQAIFWLLAKKYLNSSQVAKLIQQIAKDALQYCVWLDCGTFQWRKGNFLPSWIEARSRNLPPLNLSECLNLEQARLKQWNICSNKLLSVYQRPYLVSDWEKKTLPLFGSLDFQAIKQLSKFMVGRISIRQLALLLKKDELNVAQILSPYIDEQIIYLRNSEPAFRQFPTIPKSEGNNQQSSAISKILCIDDSLTILKEIKRFLAQEMFEVTTIEDPTQAVSKVFNIKPDLILLDINMPEVNGYELCKLLKKSGRCEQTPIVMVTVNSGIIDKARAKMVGASDYFTKPFTQGELINLVKKHL